VAESPRRFVAKLVRCRLLVNHRWKRNRAEGELLTGGLVRVQPGELRRFPE
jgi:hypothetical protein